MHKAGRALEMFSLTEAPETNKGDMMCKVGGARRVYLYWLESENGSDSDIASRANIKEPAKEIKEKIQTRMHFTRIRTARLLPYGGVSLTEPPPPTGQRLPRHKLPRQRPLAEIPLDRDTPLDKDCPQTATPWTENPLDRNPPGQRPPRQRPPPGQRPPLPGQRPPERDPPGQRHPLGQRLSRDRDPLDSNPRTETPRKETPWTETPTWTETPSLDRDPSPGQRPPGQRPRIPPC